MAQGCFILADFFEAAAGGDGGGDEPDAARNQPLWQGYESLGPVEVASQL